MALTLVVATKLVDGVSEASLSRALKVAQEESKVIRSGQVNLALVDEPTARKLNEQFAGNDYATDVLSFDYFEGENRQSTASDTVGEIVICAAVALKQAVEHQIDLSAEVTLLFVHGVLHLLGHDHHDEAEASFSTLQSVIMSKLKIDSRDIFHGNV